MPDPVIQEILFPVLTGLTLVFAGILVGYFLWFRDRSEQLILSEQLATENERLSAELRSRSSRHVELEDYFSQINQKNTSLQQLCDDLLKSREKIQNQSNSLESELYAARTKLDQTREQLTEESRFKAKTEENSHLAQQKYLNSVMEIENEWKEKCSTSHAALVKQDSEVRRLTDINQQLAARLHQSKSDIAELKSELTVQQEILATAKTNEAGLAKEYVTLESSMRAQIEMLNESRGQTAAALSAKHLAEEGIAASDQQFRELQDQIRILETEVSKTQILEDRCQHLENSLQLSSERIYAVVAQRDDAFGKQEAVEKDLIGMRKRADIQRDTIEKLRSQTVATDRRRQKHVGGLNNQVKQLESANAELLVECSHLKKQFADSQQLNIKNHESLKRVSEDNARLITKLSEQTEVVQASLISSGEYKSRIESVIAQRDNAFDELSSLKSEINRIRNHAKSNEDTIRNLRRERGAILMRNRDVKAQYPRIHNASLEFSKADQLSREYGGTTTTDPVRGPVFVEPPRERDDLKRIFGIAEVLEEKLNEFGIFTFKQITEWDERAIQEFSELLVFKDRIHRDDWLGQATKLYFKKTQNVAA